MSAQLAIAEVGPEPLPALSQWGTPPALAAELVALAGKYLDDARARGFTPHVLEPSAGRGNIVHALLDRCPHARVDVVDIDPRYYRDLAALVPEEQIGIGDYLVRPAPAQRYDLAPCNLPFDGGEEGGHLAKLLDESERIVALLPARSFHGRERYELVWHRFDPRNPARDWWIHQRVHCIGRPKFGSSGGSDEIELVDLRRVPGACVERWL
jgi:hypothetical protein